jgi:hypothetical protein
LPDACAVLTGVYTRRCAEGEVQRQSRVARRCLDTEFPATDGVRHWLVVVTDRAFNQNLR